MKAGWRAQQASEECVITALPLYHIFALSVNCLIFTRHRRQEHPDSQSARHAWLRRRTQTSPLHAFTSVNACSTACCTRRASTVDFSAVKLTIGGGAVQQAVAEQWQKRTASGSPKVTAHRDFSRLSFSGQQARLEWHHPGVPLPSTDVSLRDDDNNVVPLGRPGELCVRGPGDGRLLAEAEESQGLLSMAI